MTFLVEWAYTHGQLPSEVLKQYEENPTDFRLLMAFRIYDNERQEKHINKNKPKTDPPTSGRLSRR